MTERRLPIKQLIILSICRFAEPIALTSVAPYVPEMMESFGIAENDIAWWAGFTSATFSLCQSFTGIPWGAASDRFGRKPIILLGLFNTMVTMLIWGFSTSLPMALTARALQGLGNGNVGILRTTVAEMCPWKELQPRAFSIMPLVYTIGAIFGPTLGGLLSNPYMVDPHKPRSGNFLQRNPYCLPNITAATLFFIGIVTGWLFLKESHITKKYDRDYGLIVGAKLTAWVRKTFNAPNGKTKVDGEREPLLGNHKATNDVEATPNGTARKPGPDEKPKLRDVLNFQTTLNLVVYTILALYTLGYDQLLPVFMHHRPLRSIDDPSVSLPLKFAGGFGIDHRRIGVIFTCYAVASTLSQFLLFPPLAQRLGVLRCMRIAFLIFPVIFFVTPFIALLPTQSSKEAAMVFILVFRGLAGTFAFPTSTIMLTNSATSLRVLGTINGLATSVSAVGRACGPAVGGTLFTWGVKRGYVIIPFWVMSAISLLAWIPTLWLVEGKGFGDDSDPESDEDEDSESTVSVDQVGVPKPRQAEDDGFLSESEYGEPTNLLSYTSTRSSIAVSEAEMDVDVDDVGERHHGRRGMSDSLSRARSHSHGRRGRSVRKRSSVPIGMGTGFRRLSSNIGSTGIGAGGASWGGT